MNPQTIKRIISAVVFLFLFAYITLPLFKSPDDYITRIESLDEYNMISTGFIYVGSNDCPGCVTLMPVVKEISTKREIMVSFIDYAYLINNDIATVGDINDISERFGIERIPLLLELVNGEVVASYTSDIFNLEGVENAKMYCDCLLKSSFEAYPDATIAMELEQNEIVKLFEDSECIDNLLLVKIEDPWTEEVEQLFIEDCKIAQGKKGIDDAEANAYCTCGLSEIKKIIPNPQHVMSLTEEELASILENCK